MTVMVRPAGKAKRLFFKIMGVPATYAPRTKAEKQISKRLMYEDTRRAR